MKIITCVAVFLLGALVTIEAYPQQATFQHLVYYPPPPPPPQPIRVRRQVLGGQVSTNPAGGADVKLEVAKGFGTPEHNVIASAFAAGNTNKGPVTTGGTLAYNLHDHGLSLTKEHIPGVRDSLTQSAHVNLFNDNKNKINLNAFASQNKLANGFEFDRNGGGLSWANKGGHGAAATFSNIPDIGSQLGLSGKANLWSSADKATTFDLNAGASKWISGPFSGQKDFNAGFGLTHTFG